MDPALACSHGQGDKAELFSLSSKETNKKKPKMPGVCAGKAGLMASQEGKGTVVFCCYKWFVFFFKFSCREFSIPKGRQERQLYFPNSNSAALSNGLNTKEVCWKFLIG